MTEIKLEVPSKFQYTEYMKNKNYKGVEISTSYNEMSFCKEDGDVKTWVSDKKIEDLGKIISEELVTECKNWLLKDYEEMTEEDALEYASEFTGYVKVLNKNELCVGFSEESMYFIVSEDSEWYNKLDKESEELSSYLQEIDFE
jgi:hypothetical protein